MAGNEYHEVRPHEAQDRTRIAAGSPLAVLGLFLEVMRERFHENAGLGIVWREDVQTTDILIEVGYNVETESRNPGRALYINRLNTVPTQIVVGDRAGVHLPDHMEGFTCMMGMQISIDCQSNDSGESQLLADIVQHFFLASRQIMCAMYGIHDIGVPEMGQTQPFDHDQSKFVTSVGFSMQFQARWSTVKIRPLLQSVGLRATSNTGGFEQRAIASLQRLGVSSDNDVE